MIAARVGDPIRAYALPTEVARYDTTTFSVYHVPGEDGDSLLNLP